MAMSHQHHAFDYIEITVTDVAVAQRFYGHAFGWTFKDYGPAYAGIVIGGREAGGLAAGVVHPSPSSGPSNPLVILYSADLEATLKAVKGAGGRIVTPPYPFPGGRRFHFADPGGTMMAVWSPGAAHL